MKTTTLKTIKTEHIPEVKQPGILYVSEPYEIAIHLCACGCGGEAVTPFRNENSGWVYTEENDGPTLNPSIGHQHWPCRSHYFVRNGKIEFCSDHIGQK